MDKEYIECTFTAYQYFTKTSCFFCVCLVIFSQRRSRIMSVFNATTKEEQMLMHFYVFRSSIFLSCGMCGGLAGLVWSLRSLPKEKSGRRQNPGVFLTSLLLCDAIQLVSTFSLIVYLKKWINGLPHSSADIVFQLLWTFSRSSGLFFHQMVALEGILALAPPPCFSRLRFGSCLVSIVAWIFFSAVTFSQNVHLAVLPHSAVSVALQVAAWILCASKPPLSRYTTILAVSTFTLVLLYLPVNVFVGLSVVYGKTTLVGGYFCTPTVGLSLSNLRLISDPVLIVLVSRVKEHTEFAN